MCVCVCVPLFLSVLGSNGGAQKAGVRGCIQIATHPLTHPEMALEPAGANRLGGEAPQAHARGEMPPDGSSMGTARNLASKDGAHHLLATPCTAVAPAILATPELHPAKKAKADEATQGCPLRLLDSCTTAQACDEPSPAPAPLLTRRRSVRAVRTLRLDEDQPTGQEPASHAPPVTVALPFSAPQPSLEREWERKDAMAEDTTAAREAPEHASKRKSPGRWPGHGLQLSTASAAPGQADQELPTFVAQPLVGVPLPRPAPTAMPPHRVMPMAAPANDLGHLLRKARNRRDGVLMAFRHRVAVQLNLAQVEPVSPPPPL